MILLFILLILFFCTEHGQYTAMNVLLSLFGFVAWFFTFTGLIFVAYIMLVNKG